VERKTALDNVDVRFAGTAKLAGQQGIWGVSVNNNPTVQDPFNTLPAWRFPFTSSDYTPGPGHAPLLDGQLGGQVLGATAYTLLDNGLYAEAGAYHALSEGFLEKVHVDASSHVSGAAPYWRLAYTKEQQGRWFSAGVFGMSAGVNAYGTGGPTDKSTDVGVDGHYQILGNRRHVVSLDASFIHESQTLDASDAGAHETLRQVNVAGSYHFLKTYGLTLRHFDITGTAADAASRGWTVQGDWTPFGKENSWHGPWVNTRLGVQYTVFNTLDGATSVSGSNSIMGFVWLAL